MSNTTFEQLATGETVDYHAIVFSSFAAIKDKGGKIYVNDKLQETSRIALKDKSVKIGIELPNDVRHIDSLSVRRLNEVKTVDNILKNDEQDINLSKTYQLKYNPTNRRLEFTINNINSSSEIMTTFKDGKMPELVEQKDVSLDISDLNKGQFESIRLNKTTTDLKTTLTAKTGKVELDMYFKDKKSAKENIEKIYLVQNGKPQELPKFKNYFDLVERSSNGYYIYNGAINLKFKLSDKASLKVIYKGDKDPYSHQKEDMTKKGEQLSHSTQANENTAKVTFANIDWSHYSKVTVNGKDVGKDSELPLTKGWTTFVFRKKSSDSTFLDVTGKDGKTIELKDLSKQLTPSIIKTILKKPSLQKMFFPDKDAYYENKDTLILRINLTADTKLNFNAVKGASALTENMMMRQFAVAGPQDDPVSEHKYPSVFLLTPALLETASEATLNGKEITASGIIGHIKDGDKIKHVEVKMVNENGDTLGTPVIIQGKDLTNRTKPLMSGRRVLYAGKQYEFRAKLPLSRFNTWIRVEVVTEAGEKASIVRRMFFDQSVPELNTAVAKRDLTSDTALIHIVAKDDSLKLKLYQDDSLLESVDKTGLYSFWTNVK